MAALAWLTALAAVVPPGVIVDEVRCEADAAQSYAVYLPSRYSPERTWPVILAFDPRGRGRTPVERYQAAAEKYGYIVAGSNNSRNGPWAISMKAAQEMTADVTARFRIDARRVYTAGMSGGARVAMGVALGTNLVAGVVASSAGFPDSKPRKSVPFVVFGTAGTEDFNYHEMRQMDAPLKSPHRLAVFEGGHVWLSSGLAEEAVEWLELQAMATGRATRDEAMLQRAFETRAAKVDRRQGLAAAVALEELAADFQPFRDVSAFAARAAALRKDKGVREAQKRLGEEDRDEDRKLATFLDLERQLNDQETRQVAMSQLRIEWTKMAAETNGREDTATRRIARRVMRGMLSGMTNRSADAVYGRMVAEIAATSAVAPRPRPSSPSASPPR